MFAYSDVTHAQVMHLASRALACGADFALLGPERDDAVRAAAGDRRLRRAHGLRQEPDGALDRARRLRERGLRVAALRHPMPYGDLVAASAASASRSRADLDAALCTIEEREEYEP